MDNRPSSRRNFIASAIWFGMSAIIAIVMLLTATVIWLSELTGSFMVSVLIVGGFFAVLSVLIYLLTIRDALDELREQVETVYEVARAAKMGYEWVSEKIVLFMRLRESMRSSK